MTREAAFREAVETCGYRMGGAVVVRYADGEYDAVPGAYLKDISWIGHERDWKAVWRIESPDDLPRGDVPVEELGPEAIAVMAEILSKLSALGVLATWGGGRVASV